MAPPEYVKKYEQFESRAQMHADLECLGIAMARVMKSLRDKGTDRDVANSHDLSAVSHGFRLGAGRQYGIH